MPSVRSRFVGRERPRRTSSGCRPRRERRQPRARPPRARPAAPPRARRRRRARPGRPAPLRRRGARRPCPGERVVPTTSWPARDEQRHQLRAQRPGRTCEEDLHHVSFGLAFALRRDGCPCDAAVTRGTEPRPGGREHDDSEAFEELRPLLFSIAYRMLGSGRARPRTSSRRRSCATSARSRTAREIESPKAYLSAVDDAARDRPAALGARPPRALRRRPGCPSRSSPTRGRRRPTRPRPRTRSRWRSSSCSRASRRSSGRCSCCARSSTTATTRSPRWSGKTEDNCRQIAVARAGGTSRQRSRASRRRRRSGRSWRRRFFAAATRPATPTGLVGMLAADVVLYGDGGGKAPAVPRPDLRPRACRQGDRRLGAYGAGGRPAARAGGGERPAGHADRRP